MFVKHTNCTSKVIVVIAKLLFRIDLWVVASVISQIAIIITIKVIGESKYYFCHLKKSSGIL